MPAHWNRRGSTGFSIAIQLIVVLVVIGMLFAVGGNMMQANRDTQTAATPAFVLGDTALNMTTSSATFLSPLGYVIGGLLVLSVGVLILIFIGKQIMRSAGMGGGGRRGGRFGG